MNKPAALSDWLWQWEWGHPWHSTSFHCYFLYGGASCRFLANTFSSVLSAQKITSLQAFTAFSVSVTHIHTLAISTPFDLNTLNCGTLESWSTINQFLIDNNISDYWLLGHWTEVRCSYRPFLPKWKINKYARAKNSCARGNRTLCARRAGQQCRTLPDGHLVCVTCNGICEAALEWCGENFPLCK